MKLKNLIYLSFCLLFLGCTNDAEINLKPVSITFNFSHFWQSTAVTNADFNTIKFTNENGQQISIERLRYVISDIVLTHKSGQIVSLKEHNLVDVTNNQNLSFTTSKSIFPGEYTRVTFRFGFSNQDNVDGAYADLNTANFNVPSMLGGGYHYMQFDGKYLDVNSMEAPFNYHAIRAVDRADPNNPTFLDTSLVVDLGAVNVESNTQINVKMNLYEWFSNPNRWNLNLLNTVLMPNFSAQVQMSQNGANVFSLVNVTP